MFFSGKAINSKRVDLRGKSKSEESRDQILERARQERLKRQETRRRHQSAVVIQAFWRGRSIAAKWIEKTKVLWLQQYMNGPVDPSHLLDPKSNYVRGFLVFCGSGKRFQWERDQQLLVSVCSTIINTTSSTGQLAFITPAAQLEWRPLIVFRATRLCSLCLQALHDSRSVLLMNPGSVVSSSTQVLINFLTKFAAPDTWRTLISAPEASQVVHELLTHMASKGMFTQLASILYDCGSADSSKSRKGPAEALPAQLVIRFLSVSPASSPLSSSMLPLLCVPNLWLRCPALSPISGRLVANCTRSCAELDPHQLAASLPQGIMAGGKVASAAALLSNIMFGALKALQAEKSPAAARTLHANLATLLQNLLVILPLDIFFPSRAASTSEPSTSAPCLSSGFQPLPWDEEEMVPTEILTQVRVVFEREGMLVLQQLIGAILPHTTLQAEGREEQSSEGVQGLCRLLSLLLTHTPHQQELLLRLAVACGLVQRLWFSFIQPTLERDGLSGPGGRDSNTNGETWWMLPLSVLSPVFHCWLQTADILEDFHKQQQPLPHDQLYNSHNTQVGLITLLKVAVWQLLWLEFERTLNPPNPARVTCARSSGQLLQLLFDLNSRRPFVPVHAFHATERFTAEALNAAKHSTVPDEGSGPLKTQLGATSSRSWAVLHYAPCLVPFLERARLFQEIVSEDREYHVEMERQSQHDAMTRGIDIDHSQRFLTIRRDHLVTDGFDHLDKLGEKLKGRIRIQFINEHGVAEAGVDGGGLFKDFMEELIKQGFNPEYGVFKTTPANQLYPNPAAYQILHDAPRMLAFMGRMLGKALYEGILSELPFAGFFLKRFRGSYCSLSDLPSLDPEVYRSLMVLRHYKGDLADLCLTFSIIKEEFGRQTEVALKPGGKDISVSADNVVEYIHRIADFRLNKEMHAASSAFLSGFFDIINPAWVRMFNEEEIQMLISGSDATAEELLELQQGDMRAVAQQRAVRGLDIQDMKTYTSYAGGYDEEHPVIITFWEALSTMEPKEQRSFLKFVTSSSRAPLLGFKYLEPPLCIQMAGHMMDPSATERLPTSATCMNMLKLPPYLTLEQMKKKLLMSSQFGQGFHLS